MKNQMFLWQINHFLWKSIEHAWFQLKSIKHNDFQSTCMKLFWCSTPNMQHYRILIKIYEQSKVSITSITKPSTSINIYQQSMIFNQNLWTNNDFQSKYEKMFWFSIQNSETLNIFNQTLWTIKGFYNRSINFNQHLSNNSDFQSKPIKQTMNFNHNIWIVQIFNAKQWKTKEC